MTDPVAAAAPDPDAVRERLLDAAATVFAEQGYDGARIQDVVRTAGLTTGAVYGRYRGKDELLHDAVVTRAVPQVQLSAEGIRKVADLVAAGATNITPGLTEREALLLESYVAARREPAVADAIADADRRWRNAVAPLVDAATEDGTIAADLDPDAVLFLVRVLRLGMLLHRGSGLPSPEPDGWTALVDRVVASFGAATAPAPHPPTDHTPSQGDLPT
ncbi:MAG: TetR family transcriptional regulator [Acidimicrobiales bacterium]